MRRFLTLTIAALLIISLADAQKVKPGVFYQKKMQADQATIDTANVGTVNRGEYTVPSNGVWDWNQGDNAVLNFQSATPTISFTQLGRNKFKQVKITASTTVTSITWPAGIFWASPMPTSFSAVRTDFWTFTNFAGQVVAWQMGTSSVVDNTPPSAIMDLAVVSKTATSVTLGFTSPNANPGTASVYDARYSTNSIGEVAGSGTAGFTYAFDAAAFSDFDTYGATISWSHTVTSAQGNRAIFAAVGYQHATVTISSVMCGSQAMTLVGFWRGAADICSAIYKLMDPPTGANTMTITLSGDPGRIKGGSWSFTGVEQSVPTGAFTHNEDAGATSTAAISIPTESGNLAVANAITDGAWFTGRGASQTTDWDLGYGIVMGGEHATAAGTTRDLSWTMSGTDEWVTTGVAIKPNSGSGAVIAWSTATQATGEPNPGPAGTGETITIAGLTASTQYRVRVKSADAAGNVSDLSNEVTVTTDPTSVTPPTDPQDGSTVYYVSTTGSGSNSGTTSGSPWTLAKAITDVGESTSLAAGYDTVFIQSGTYNVELSPARAGLANHRIVWKKRGTSPVIIQGVAGQIHTMNLTQPYHTFDGLTIQNQNPNDVPLYSISYDGYYMVTVTAHGIEFRNCLFPLAVDPYVYDQGVSERRYRAIVVGSAYGPVQYFKAVGCRFDNWNIGICLTGSTPRYHTIRRNSFYNTYQSPINLQASQDGSTQWHGTLIDSNYIGTSLIEDNIQFEDYQPNRGLTNLDKGTIIRDNELDTGIENAIDLKTASYVWIERNFIHGTTGDDDGTNNGNAHDMGSGPAIERLNQDPGTDHITVLGNIIWDNMKGITTSSVTTIANNVFQNNRRNWAGPNQTGYEWYHVLTWSPSGPVEIFNNMFLSVGTGNNSSFMEVTEGSSIFTISNNLYYDSLGGTRWASFHWSGGNIFTYYNSFSAWKAAYGWDATGSMYANPLFLNTPQYTYNRNVLWTWDIQSGSPARDAGRPHGYTSGTAVNSVTCQVTNANIFRSNFGNPDISGHIIRIGGGAAVEITNVDYSTNTLTLASPRSWSAGASIIITDFCPDLIPDIGAKQYVP